MKTYHHHSNDYLLNSSVNVTFDELIGMGDDEFRKWCLRFRKEVKRSWEEYNQPPVPTSNDDTIIRQMDRLTDMSVEGTVTEDTMTNTTDCVVMKSPISVANCFFPNMGKMKDINTTDMEGMSLWDYFVEGKNTEEFITKIRRNFKFDSFYSFSPTIVRGGENSFGLSDGKVWVKRFRAVGIHNHDFWLEPVEDTPKGFIYLKGTAVGELVKEKLIKPQNFNGGVRDFEEDGIYRIRIYKKNQRVLKVGMKFLKQGLVMMGVNFPPSIAKWVYSHFTEGLKDQSEIIIYDPSMGYGGRLLGSLSLCGDRKVHYIGTDPNTDNFIDELGMSRYEYMGRYFNSNIKRRYQTTYETFMEGSETVHKNRSFQKYKGKVDFIFTSPPYFGAEGYSEDETQSYKKFPTYEEWRDGFLTQTLKNCVDWLRPGRWMCWNISDVQFNGKYYPLERDSVELMKSLGMEYRSRYKMVLSNTIQKKNVRDRTRLPSTKNFCGQKNIFKKYEPIFCFYKPL
jgi:hypothetical protein